MRRAKWTLRIGLVVRRESIPLHVLQGLGPDRYGVIAAALQDGRSIIFPVSDDVALFAAPHWLSPFDEAAVVDKGSVKINGNNAQIEYRSAVGATLVAAVWFGFLFVWEFVMWRYANEPLFPALVGLAMMTLGALVVRHAIRVQVGILRGIAAEAARLLGRNTRARS